MRESQHCVLVKVRERVRKPAYMGVKSPGVQENIQDEHGKCKDCCSGQWRNRQDMSVDQLYHKLVSRYEEGRVNVWGCNGGVINCL